MNMQALHEGQQAPRGQLIIQKAERLPHLQVPVYLIFPFHTLPPVLPTLLHINPPKPTQHLPLHPPTKTSRLLNLAHHHAHHLSFSSSQCVLGKELSLTEAPESDGSAQP